MSNKPIFCATHPRACSTAFERVFMTRRDTIKSVHEPFGDAFYYGPERLSTRFEHDIQAREQSGFSNSTYKTIFDQIDEDNSEVRPFPFCSTLDFGAYHAISLLQLYLMCYLVHTTHWLPTSHIPYSYLISTPAALPRRTPVCQQSGAAGPPMRNASLHFSDFCALHYRTILIAKQGKRIFIKDIIHYLVPPDGKPPSIAPSLGGKKKGVGTNGLPSGHTNGLANGHMNGLTNGLTNGHKKTNSQTNICGEEYDESQTPYPFATNAEPNNPTVVPAALLSKFHFTFLIRDPHSSIPSYFRCTIPPLDDVTGFHHFDPSEAGYDETRRVFEYLLATGQVGPHHANGWNSNANRHTANGQPAGAEICVVDADDLLDDPEGIIRAYCTSVGLPFEPEMLEWADDKHQAYAKKTFAKWPGFHEDAIDSTDLKPRAHGKKIKTEEQWDKEWVEKYGEEAAKTIRETVDRNMDDYNYMRQFVLKAKA